MTQVRLSSEQDMATRDRLDTRPALTAHGTSRQAPVHKWIRRAALGDALSAAAASLAALLLHFGWSDAQQGTISYALVGLLVTLAWPLLLAVSGAYELPPSLFGVEGSAEDSSRPGRVFQVEATNRHWSALGLEERARSVWWPTASLNGRAPAGHACDLRLSPDWNPSRARAQEGPAT